MTFNELQIIEPILKALINEGYSIPTPIQEQAIPILLQGRDILGCAQTGTGKTAAFSIPIIQKLYENRDVADVNTGRNSKKQRKNIKALVLTPTRELAAQIGDSFSSYGKFTSLKHTVIYGGVRQRSQTDAIRNGVDILVATPGRLLDLVNQGHVNLRHIEFFVLDEADRMLDMGFITDIKRVIDLIPQSRQTLLFSATMPSEISSLAESLLNNPVKVEVTPVEATVDLIDQYLYFADRGNKTPLLIDLLNDDDVESALIFSRTKHGADKLSKSLTRAGINCDAIHGNKSQNARQKSLSDFKRKRTRVLVATDIAARGIDINQISHVINYDLPEAAETYVHRIGRTGRAGYSGVALSFCDSGELGMLKSIQKLIGKDINVIAGHEFECAVCVEKIERLKKSVAKGKERTGSGLQTVAGTQEKSSSNRYKGKRTKGEFWQKGRRRSA
ncbi:MAG: DEAD/DEAH box helicase [Bacteroidetes bacterium HGW-Bacteroidetes-5]|jgi:ATP-dependent RNA helicase RhlE|nr:MAG: DEAD/DEAH box helicase [Bacteroidetes bacterium HGW-Bacteroidetes-5]